MRRSSGLLCFIVGSLLIVCNLAASSFSPSFQEFRKFSFVSSLPVAPASQHVISKRPGSNDHIKVRYMGGDCGYDPSFSPITFKVITFNEHVRIGAYTSFIFSSSVALFQLRGPPVGEPC